MAALSVLLMSLPVESRAGSFHVSPVRVELSSQEKSSVLRVENNGQTTVTIQLHVVAWAQKDGKDLLTPTRELIATPPIFNLKPGATQLIRIGMLRKVDPEKELSYRLILEEIPPPPAPDFKGLQVALRIGLPVFIKPDTSAQQQLKFAIERLDAGSLWLTMTNQGLAHTQLFGLKLYPEAKADSVLATHDASLYLLPGQERRLLLKQIAPIGLIDPTVLLNAAPTDVGRVLIKAQTRAGLVESYATIVSP
jgi:fimbrial chaperone protein